MSKKGAKAKQPATTRAPLRRAGLRVRLPAPKVETPETVYDRKRQKKRDKREIREELGLLDGCAGGPPAGVRALILP